MQLSRWGCMPSQALKRRLSCCKWIDHSHMAPCRSPYQQAKQANSLTQESPGNPLNALPEITCVSAPAIMLWARGSSSYRIRHAAERRIEAFESLLSKRTILPALKISSNIINYGSKRFLLTCLLARSPLKMSSAFGRRRSVDGYMNACRLQVTQCLICLLICICQLCQGDADADARGHKYSDEEIRQDSSTDYVQCGLVRNASNWICLMLGQKRPVDLHDSPDHLDKRKRLSLGLFPLLDAVSLSLYHCEVLTRMMCLPSSSWCLTLGMPWDSLFF